MITNKNLITDASGEREISKILSNTGPKNPKQILESLYDYSKSNMRLKRTTSFKDSSIKPNVQDVGLLGFSL